MTANRQDVARFEAIISEMENLLEDAKNIMRRNADSFHNDRASAYWVGSIENALSAPVAGNCDMLETLDHMQGNLPEDTDCQGCGCPIDECDCQDSEDNSDII